MKKNILYSILFLFTTISLCGLYYGLYGVPDFLSDSSKTKIGKSKTKIKSEAKIKDTILLPLSVKTINFEASPVHPNLAGSGGITKIGNHALILYGNHFYFFNLKKEKFTKLDMAAPPNNHKVARNLWREKNLNHRKSHVVLTRYTDVLAIQSSTKITLLISFAHFNRENACLSNRVARVDFPIEQSPLTWKVRAQDWRTIFKNPCLEKSGGTYYNGSEGGGVMTPSENPDHIFLTIGEYGVAIQLKNKNPAYGRIVKINIHNGHTKTISVGHRNPQGIVFVPAKNGKQDQLWSVEHGPKGGDELNLIQQGKHYGWPFTSYGTSYGFYRLGKEKHAGRHENYQKPVFAFVPSVGTSNITLIENFAEPWDGDLLIASMKARSLYRMRVVDNRVVHAEPIQLDRRIRTILSPGNGSLLALVDQKPSVIILRVIPEIKKKKIVAPPEVLKRTRAVWKNCLSCHKLNLLSPRAPSFYRIMGRKVGQTGWKGYSAAMKSSDLVWDRALLTAFLKDPNGTFEGTSMPPTGIQDPRVIKAIVDHLEKIK